MERSFEAVLVEQCATTLAGVKPASLFRYQGADKRQPREAAARWAKELAPYGITIRVLKYCPQTGALSDLPVPGRMASVDPLGAIHPRLSGGAGVWGGSELSGAAETAFQAAVPGAGIPPMRSASFWATPWRMWWASSGTGAGTTPAADTGRPTATRRRHKSVSINTAAALPPAVSSSGRARPSRS